ncbi:MAG: reverse transcriptase/maturase family protein [Methylococcaceae bacterium]
MKSHGGLFARIITQDNLAAALKHAARGKSQRPAVQDFLKKSESQLSWLQQEIQSGEYRPRPYQQFTILDPKPRRISCADFRDRVVHHAICAVIAPLIDRRLIDDNFACRLGKGSHRALQRAQYFAGRHPWFLKTDIQRYYDTIDHALLLARLEKMFRESALLHLLEIIIRQPIPGQTPGKGLPIGNLTSQWLANLYLDPLDHWVKEQRRVPGYVRYMDDIACWDAGKEALFALSGDMRAFLAEELKLTLKEQQTINAPVGEGMPFLGWRVYPALLRQQGKRLRRQRRLIKQREDAYLNGVLDEQSLRDSILAIAGPRRFLGYGEAIRSQVDV